MIHSSRREYNFVDHHSNANGIDFWVMESLSKACFTVPIGGWLAWLLSHFAHKDNISDGNWIEEGVAICTGVSEFSQTATQTRFEGIRNSTGYNSLICGR